jgi:hypothetical protein
MAPSEGTIRIIHDRVTGLPAVQWNPSIPTAELQEWLREHGISMKWGHLRRAKTQWTCPIAVKYVIRLRDHRAMLLPPDERTFDTYEDARRAGIADGLGVGWLGEVHSNGWFVDEVF